MRVGLIALLIVLALVVLTVLGGGCMVYGAYKDAIRLDEEVKSTWSNVDVALKRRYDLIPNFVETVKGYAKHEAETLQKVIAARNDALQAKSPGQAAAAASALSGALRLAVKVVNERYPDLKANENFRALMIELEGSENRIAEMRKRYNAAVKQLNTHIRGPIGSIAASWADVEKAEYFEAGEGERETPKVAFD
ncbi:MAG: LemA family protein [Phycisphaerae bacterium]